MASAVSDPQALLDHKTQLSYITVEIGKSGVVLGGGKAGGWVCGCEGIFVWASCRWLCHRCVCQHVSRNNGEIGKKKQKITRMLHVTDKR